MRTTLDLEPSVLAAAKELARRRRTTAGAVISDLARQALAGELANPRGKISPTGFRPFASRGGIVTNAQVNQLREETGA